MFCDNRTAFSIGLASNSSLTPPTVVVCDTKVVQSLKVRVELIDEVIVKFCFEASYVEGTGVSQYSYVRHTAQSETVKQIVAMKLNEIQYSRQKVLTNKLANILFQKKSNYRILFLT